MGSNTVVGDALRSDWGWLAPAAKGIAHLSGSTGKKDTYEDEKRKASQRFWEQGARMQPDMTSDMLRALRDAENMRQGTGRTRQGFFGGGSLLGGGQ